MNRTKRELYEDNQKLRKQKKIYSEFWETDAIEECTKQMKFTKKFLYGLSIAFLIIGAFLIGLAW